MPIIIVFGSEMHERLTFWGSTLIKEVRSEANLEAYEFWRIWNRKQFKKTNVVLLPLKTKCWSPQVLK